MQLFCSLYRLLLPIVVTSTVVIIVLAYGYQSEQHKQSELIQWENRLNAALETSYKERQVVQTMANRLLHLSMSATASHSEIDYDIIQRGVVDGRQLSDASIIGRVNVYIVDDRSRLVYSSDRLMGDHQSPLTNEIYREIVTVQSMRAAETEVTPSGRLYRTIKEQIAYLYSMPIAAPSPESKPYLFVITAPLDSLNQLAREGLFANQYRIDLVPLSSLTSGHKTESSFIHRNMSDGVELLKRSNGLEVTLRLYDGYFVQANNKILLTTTVYAICVVLLLVAAVHVALQIKIARPIKALIEEIRFGRQQLRYFDRSKAKDEISVLKNAYIDSLTKMKFEAEFDSLTRLANRHSFMTYIQRRFESYDNDHTYVVCWDVVEFRKINDLYGTEVGDQLLLRLGQRISDALVSHQTANGFGCSDYSIARFAGNQFYIVIEAPEESDIVTIIQNMVLQFSAEMEIGNYRLSPNIASAIFPLFLPNAQHLWYKGLEAALSVAKTSLQLMPVTLYDDNLVAMLQRRDNIEKRLLESIANDNFVLKFMPIFEAKSLQLSGCEVLLRSPLLAELNASPDEFIPIAEKANLITQIDKWVVEHAVAALLQMRTAGYTGTMAINISALELYNRSFPTDLLRLVELANIAPELITLELTETSYVKSSKETTGILTQLRDRGFKVSLDDFGTGYTSINQLISFPVDELKIDKSFTEKAQDQESDRTMLKAIISMAHACNAKVVGEGVETAYQGQYLTSAQCDYLQGFYLAKPMDLDQMLAFIDQYDTREARIKISNLTVLNG